MKAALFFATFLSSFVLFGADSLLLQSPDKKIAVTIYLKNRLAYTIRYEAHTVLQTSAIDMELAGNRKLSNDLRTGKTSFVTVDEKIFSPVPEKRREITNHYNQVSIRFRQPFTVEFRAYNDGVAYRLFTHLKDSINVQHEVAEFNLAQGNKVLFADVRKRQDADRFHTSFESLYQLKEIDSLDESLLAYSPVVTGVGNEMKLAITESDLEDYPGMFLTGKNGAGLKGVFAPFPLEETIQLNGEFLQPVITKRAPFISRTKGSRHFPWRALLIGRDKDLPANDLVYRLASPSRIQDASWIRPGQCTDEWIIGINLFNVPFKSGINTATYKYYIDFANKFGIERVMLDAGWSDYNNLFNINKSIDMDILAAYARSRGVGLGLWTLSMTLDKQLDSALKQFNKWDVDFIMTDFMDRDDQPMVNYFHRIAKACADHNIMIMFHGAYPPKGLNRTWPNVLTTEGVLGSEFNIWSRDPDPEHDVTLPFTRMLAGPMDYEPGLLDNATKEQFRPIDKKVMSQGTRCHQLAMYVVYDSPLQVFSGNPSQGMLEPEFMHLLGSIPTTWDETKIIDAKISDYIITARKKGEDWFIGGMTDWSPRNFQLMFDFLEEGSYDATLCKDGINADNYPSDYELQNFTVRKGETVPLSMAPGGGFLLKVTRRK